MGETDRGSSPKPIDLPVDDVSEKKTRKRRGSLELTEATVAQGVVAVFATVGLATGHKHWQKKADQVAPISGPLTEMLNGLPPALVEKLTKHANTGLLLFGLATVVGRDVMIELEIRKLEKSGWKPQAPPNTTPPTPTAPPPSSDEIPVAPTFSGAGIAQAIAAPPDL